MHAREIHNLLPALMQCVNVNMKHTISYNHHNPYHFTILDVFVQDVIWDAQPGAGIHVATNRNELSASWPSKWTRN